MISFKPIEIGDKSWVDPITMSENSKSADFSFTNMFIWDRSYMQQIARVENRLIVMPMYDESPFFAYPVGSGDIRPAIGLMRQYAKEHGFVFTIRGATKEHIPILESAFPGRFQFEESRYSFDYVYYSEKLASLAGKKLSAKRNHINRFLEQRHWSYEPLTTDLIPQCLEMLDLWQRINCTEQPGSIDDEHDAILRAFEYYDSLCLEGGLLRVDGKVAAFSLGSLLAKDTFNVSFEKAFSEIQGAYPMVNREFVRQVLSKYPAVEYINREDDMGLENLRRSKLSYHPALMVEKYIARWID